MISRITRRPLRWSTLCNYYFHFYCIIFFCDNSLSSRSTPNLLHPDNIRCRRNVLAKWRNVYRDRVLSPIWRADLHAAGYKTGCNKLLIIMYSLHIMRTVMHFFFFIPFVTTDSSDIRTCAIMYCVGFTSGALCNELEKRGYLWTKFFSIITVSESLL